MQTFTCPTRKIKVTAIRDMIVSSDLGKKSFIPGRLKCTGSNNECTKENCPLLNGNM